MSILPQPGGYVLRMNRDERLERTDDGGLTQTQEGVWPVDPISGGTWIGANARGLALALLNRYPAGPGGSGCRSRGAIIPQALRAGGTADALALVGIGDLGTYAPFLLLAFGTSGPWRTLYWDGVRLRLRAWPRAPKVWTSSSVGGWRVLMARRRTFSRTQDPGLGDPWSGVHASHEGLGAICVHRDGGGTVAAQEVMATPQATVLLHRPGPACGTGRFRRVELSRVPELDHAA